MDFCKTMIPFNKPYLTGKETQYILDAVHSGKISGDGEFSRKCQKFFETYFQFGKCLLTTSCTDALEMAAILINISPGDEVIIPSYTFVSTANAFVLRGAKIKFCDSGADNPNIDPDQIEKLISKNTKAIVVVHYAGVACDMDKIMKIAQQYSLYVIEDAAQAIHSYYKGRALGSFGSLSAFSFHETKNVQCGEGGMIVINDEELIGRAEIIREKGTNRSAFFRGQVDKYNWVDMGSSFLPSDLLAAFLYAQLENLEGIQRRRILIWEYYYSELSVLESEGLLRLPFIPEYATNNAHMFYLVCRSEQERDAIILRLKENGILAVFHYQSLHLSPFYKGKYVGEQLINAERYSKQLLRLPLFYELQRGDQQKVVETIYSYFKKNHQFII